MTTKSDVTDDQVLWAMREYGGGFVKSLANLYLLGDSDNQRKIKQTWSEYWAKYAEFARFYRCQSCGSVHICRPQGGGKECEECGAKWGVE